MRAIIFANLKERKILQQIMDWNKITHIRFQMTFINDKKNIERMLYGHKDELIIVINSPKVAKILKKMKKRHIMIKDDWYKGFKL